MVESSLLSATLPRALAGEYSQEYFRPGPDGNDRCAKQLTIIESDGRDGYSMAKALTVVGYIRFACDENPTAPHVVLVLQQNASSSTKCITTNCK